MARFKHVTTGAVVDVRDDKPMGAEWEPVKDQTPVPAKKAAAKPAAKSDK